VRVGLCVRCGSSEEEEEEEEEERRKTHQKKGSLLAESKICNNDHSF